MSKVVRVQVIVGHDDLEASDTIYEAVVKASGRWAVLKLGNSSYVGWRPTNSVVEAHRLPEHWGQEKCYNMPMHKLKIIPMASLKSIYE